MTGADERESGWTIGKVLEWSRTYLRKHESASPLLDADLLLLGVLGCERIDLYTRYDQPLQSEELAAFRQRLQRRAAGEPVAYITGRQEFFGHSFGVSPAVLIPRPDTECLVEAVIEAVIEAANGAATIPGPRILDLGCGSGCIIVSLALELKSGFFEGWDNSPGALQQARDNAADLEADLAQATPPSQTAPYADVYGANANSGAPTSVPTSTASITLRVERLTGWPVSHDSRAIAALPPSPRTRVPTTPPRSKRSKPRSIVASPPF